MPMTLLQNSMSGLSKFAAFGECNLQNISWVDDGTSGNIAGVFLVSFHIHGLTLHVKHQNRFRDGRQPSTMNLVVTKQQRYLLKAELLANVRLLGLRTTDRPPSRWFVVNEVDSSPPNKRVRISTGNVEGLVDFRLSNDLLNE